VRRLAIPYRAPGRSRGSRLSRWRFPSRHPQPRGAETFQTLANYPFDVWRKKRGATSAIAELAVTHEVRDISEMVIRVERQRESRVLEVIYER
jgi:hypothetical protein